MNSSTERQQPRSSEFQENLGILRQIQFFSGLPLEALKVFAYLCTRETFRAGDYLFHQDDNDGKAFYILSGEAELVRRDGGGELSAFFIESLGITACSVLSLPVSVWVTAKAAVTKNTGKSFKILINDLWVRSLNLN